MKFNTDSILIEGSVHGGVKVSFFSTDIEYTKDLLHKYDGKNYEVSIKEKKKQRSLNANSYYQVLVREIAEARSISEAEYHNRSLAEVGIPWKDSEDKVQYVLMKDNDNWLYQLQGSNHFAPTEHTEEKKGVTYRWFYLLKPSRFMDTKEMARLIDYVIQDAESLGIKVKSEDEIERMKQGWEIEN